MQLTILGSNGTFPSADRPASGYLVTHHGTTLWMDAGPGTYNALARLLEPTSLSGVFLSHRHPDHCSDFFALFHAVAYGSERPAPIPVIVPPGLADHLGNFLGGSAETMHQVFDFHTVEAGDSLTIGEFQIGIAEANHPPPTISPRITDGTSTLTYTADTGPSADLEAHAAGSDLLLAEATMAARKGDMFPYHMTGSEAGAMAAAAGVRRLVLTHIAPYVDHNRSLLDAEAEFDGDVSIAVPGATHTI